MRRTQFVFGCLLSLVLAGLSLAASAPLLPGEPAAPAAPAALPAAAAEVPASPPALAPATPAPLAPATPAAPAPASPAAQPVYPYTGYVNADLVNVRCGPGLYYYPLAAVSKSTRVVVESESNGWLALRPPEGVYGLVRKSDLTIGQSGASGTVSAPSARVYASSPTAKRRWCVMATIRQGDTVQVLGPAEGEWVRVAPPADARVYVVDQYVAASGLPDVPPDKPAVSIDVEPPQTDPLVEVFKKAEADLRAELAKDVPERDFEPVAAQFKDVAEKAEKAYLKDAAQRRLVHIAALAEQQAEYVRVTSLADNLDSRLADIKTRWADKQTEARHEKSLQRSDFLVTGCVAKLESLEEIDYPIKYKLVDQNNRPLVVLKSTAYDLGKYVGKIVGVRGTKTYLKEWRINLVTVDDLEVLEE